MRASCTCDSSRCQAGGATREPPPEALGKTGDFLVPPRLCPPYHEQNPRARLDHGDDSCKSYRQAPKAKQILTDAGARIAYITYLRVCYSAPETHPGAR